MNATVGGEGLQIKLHKGSTTAKTRPFWFASKNLPRNVLARQRLKKRGLTNTSSPKRAFGFSAKATLLIARPNLTKKKGEEKEERTFLCGDGRYHP